MTGEFAGSDGRYIFTSRGGRIDGVGDTPYMRRSSSMAAPTF